MERKEEIGRQDRRYHVPACLPACLPACPPACLPTLPYRASHLGALGPPIEEVLQAGVEQRDAVLLGK